MGAPVVDDRPKVSVAGPRRRRWWWALPVVGAVLGVLVYGFAREATRQVPSFPSLAAHPDASLHGTVAYFAADSGCVRIVAAAGRPSADVLCLPNPDVATQQKQGKEIGPQLVWRPDGRLEITMFRMPLTKGPQLDAGWQKVVDVRTGEVADVPAADVPSEPNLTTRPAVDPSGRRIGRTSDEQTGRIGITLTDDSGTRTLLSARGPGSYTYRLTAAFWAPGWAWVAADDGRILVVTTGRPSVTRVLVEAPRQVGEGRFPTFAVTGADLLTSPSPARS